MRGSEHTRIRKHFAIVAAVLLIPLALLVIISMTFGKEPYFGRDFYQNQLKIESRVPLGAKLSDVVEYAKNYFEAYRFDKANRCLIARFTVYSGGKMRRAEFSMRTFFYFDSEMHLTRIKHENSFTPQPLLSFEEEGQRALDCLSPETRRILEQVGR